MREVIKYLDYYCNDYVICGSLALYLHGIIDSFSGKDIDVIVDVPENAYDGLDNWIRRIDRFNGWGWSTSFNNHYIDVFNKKLPEFEIHNVDGLSIPVKSLSALKKHYTTLDVARLGGHLNFRNKMKARVALFS